MELLSSTNNPRALHTHSIRRRFEPSIVLACSSSSCNTRPQSLKNAQSLTTMIDSKWAFIKGARSSYLNTAVKKQSEKSPTQENQFLLQRLYDLCCRLSIA